MSVDFPILEESVKNKYQILRKTYTEFDDLIRMLGKINEVVILGGWVRNAIHEYMHKSQISFNDIDLVVDGQIDMQFNKIARKNNFGGYRININGNKKIDIWELRQTLAFRKNIFNSSFSNLLKTTVFTVNSVMFSINSNKVANYNAIEDIERKFIRFNCKDYLNIYPEFQSFRAIKLASDLGYALDSDIRSFIINCIKKVPPEQFLKSVKVHKRWVSKEDINEIYREWANVNYSEL